MLLPYGPQYNHTHTHFLLQVHLEVLRLLLLVCKELTPDTLAAYLAHMLEATAASRARTSSQKRKFAHLTQHSSHVSVQARARTSHVAPPAATTCAVCRRSMPTLSLLSPTLPDLTPLYPPPPTS